MNAQGWASENSGAYVEVLNHLLDDYSSENIEFAKWSVDYLRTHPNVTIEQFKNWYLGKNEGKDDFYDSEFWENPNLNFPQQELPSWNDFEDATLKNPDGSLMAGADAVYSNIGGQVWQARLNNPGKTNNTCALKISRALNY